MKEDEKPFLVSINRPPQPESESPTNYSQNVYHPPGMYPPINYLPPPLFQPEEPEGSKPYYHGYSGNEDYPLPKNIPVQKPRYIARTVYRGPTVEERKNLLKLGDQPTIVTCPKCRQLVMTNLQQRPGKTAWIICCILFFLCLPCSLYPLICNPCLDLYHFCPACQGIISIKTARINQS